MSDFAQNSRALTLNEWAFHWETQAKMVFFLFFKTLKSNKKSKCNGSQGFLFIFMIQGWLRLIGESPFSNCDSSLWLHLNLSKQIWVSDLATDRKRSPTGTD